MKTSLLLVSTNTRWYGPARIPRSLDDAGFEVSLLAPAGSLAEKSRFIARVGHLPDGATVGQWIFAFAAMVKACAPKLVVPGDDTAVRLLQMLVLAPPLDLQPALQRDLAALIGQSLGDPAGYRASIDKTLLPAAADAMGVRVATHARVANVAAATEFAAKHGYPIVLKRPHSTAGDGVTDLRQRSRDRDRVRRADRVDDERFRGRDGARPPRAGSLSTVRPPSIPPPRGRESSSWATPRRSSWATRSRRVRPP